MEGRKDVRQCAVFELLFRFIPRRGARTIIPAAAIQPVHLALEVGQVTESAVVTHAVTQLDTDTRNSLVRRKRNLMIGTSTSPYGRMLIC